jgi:cytochrome b561
MENSSSVRYGAVAQVFHWITAILVLVAFIYGPGGPEMRVYSHARDAGRQLHETLGLCVLAVVVLRVLWRLVDTQPEPPEVARWMGVTAKTVQGFLYLLLIVVPVTGVAGPWLAGHPLTLISGWDIPSWFARSRSVGLAIAQIHPWLGDAIMWLAGLHAVAGIYHHVVLKDDVLVSMLPRWLPLR